MTSMNSVAVKVLRNMNTCAACDLKECGVNVFKELVYVCVYVFCSFIQDDPFKTVPL